MATAVTVFADQQLPTSITPPSSSFVQRRIEITISLGAIAGSSGTNQPSTFGNGSSNTVTLAGSRTSVRIQNSGTPKGSEAQVNIFGLTPDIMNQLSTLGLVFQLIPQNIMSIKVGDLSAGLSTVFIGNILSAVPNFSQAPDVAFAFQCQAGLTEAVAPFDASSFPNSTDVGEIMQGLAKRMGVGFENSGVSIKLPPTYLSGSGADQFKKVARDAGIRAELIDGAGGARVLAIWPKGGSRRGAAPMVSPTTGMIGYPSYTQQGILVKSIFNPQIGFGGQIQVQSSLPRATGTWNVLKLDHALDSQVDKGLWESSMWCFNPKYPQPFPRS